MNEKTFKKALHNLARRRTAGHADIWLRMESQLLGVEPSHPRKAKMALRWATMAAATAIIMLLFVSAGAYAMHRLSIFVPGFDPGLQQAHEDQFGLEMAKSQTIHGVTATLDWVYADQHRIAVFFTISQPDSVYQPVNIMPVVILRQQDGTSLPQLFGGGGGGGGGGGSSSEGETPVPHTSWIVTGSTNFDATTITGNPAEIPLQMEILLEMEVKPVGQPDVPAYQLTTETVGPFLFDFAVPFVPATVSEAQISQTASDVTITLRRISVTPSSTQLTLCMDGLPADRYWLPEAQLDTGQEIVPDIGFIGIAPHFYDEGDQLCTVLDFLAPYRGEPANWTLTIDRLHRLEPDNAPLPEEAEQITGLWVFPISVGRE